MLARTTLDWHSELLAAADSIEPLSQTLCELATTVSDQSCSVADIAAVVRSDSALTAIALREANSVVFGSGSNIVEIEPAIVRVGAARLLANSVSAALIGSFDVAVPSYQLERGELWRHSSVMSHVVELLRPKANTALGAEVVTAALLHDLGKVLIARLADEAGVCLGSMSKAESLEAERFIFNLDHAEVGVELARLWNLPDSIGRAIGAHHEPAGLPEGHALRIADYAAHLLVPTGSPTMAPDDGGALTESLSFLEVDFDKLCERARVRLCSLGLIDDESS